MAWATVQITSVVRASDTSLNVRWTQRRFVNGAAAGLERWTAIVSIVIDTVLRNLELKLKLCKVFDRVGMCVMVSIVGTVTFRYDDHLNGSP